MKTPFKSWIVRVLALLLAASVACAQDRVPFRQEELDQMLAPVALYPDSLLSQVLMAATYPLEVVQAARWSRANPGLKGQDAVRAVERMGWDPSVKSLTAFPQVLIMMDEKLEWTERLGAAFLAQQADVMDTVQGLRRRAEAAGNLRSSERMRVSRQGEVIYIQQPAPEIVYVPYYNPVVAYGPWWWPAYPPVYWAPPVGYYVVPAHRPVFLWGPGIVISANLFFGHPDWHRRHVTVVRNTVANVTVNRTTVINQNAPTISIASSSRATVWRHDPAHRRGAFFRNPEARQRFEQSRAAATTTRVDAAPAVAAPVARTEPRPAVAAAPAPRAEVRASMPNASATPRQATVMEGGRRENRSGLSSRGHVSAPVMQRPAVAAQRPQIVHTPAPQVASPAPRIANPAPQTTNASPRADHGPRANGGVSRRQPPSGRENHREKVTGKGHWGQF